MIKKYIRATICIMYSLIKFCGIKLFHYKAFKFSPVSVISPFTEIEVGKGGRITLGKLVRMRSGSKIRARKDAELIIGDNTALNYGCIFTAHKRITIGKDVKFGPNVLIYDHDHDFRTPNGLKKLKYKMNAVEIGDNCWIGANTVILKGSKIGNNCVIGAGSIIKGRYEDNSIIIQKRDTEVIDL